jgi:hypothetical protein
MGKRIYFSVWYNMGRMNPSDSYTIKFDSGSTNRLMQMARKLGTTPSEVVAQALALLETVQGKKIILKDTGSNSSVEIKRYVK